MHSKKQSKAFFKATPQGVWMPKIETVTSPNPQKYTSTAILVQGENQCKRAVVSKGDTRKAASGHVFV